MTPHAFFITGGGFELALCPKAYPVFIVPSVLLFRGEVTVRKPQTVEILLFRVVCNPYFPIIYGMRDGKKLTSTV